MTPVDTDHSGLNKCYGSLDPVYKVIETSITDMQCLSLLDQADAWIRQSYTTEKLKIERLSNAKLPMTQCYINLALLHQHSRDEQLEGAMQPPTFRPSLLERFSIKEAEGDGGQFDLETLFDPRDIRHGEEAKSPKRILIRGRPGVGKTTLCKKIVYDFYHLQQWNDRFRRLLWVPLRRLSNRRGHYTLEDLLRQEYFGQHTSPDLMIAEMYRQCNKSDDAKTLFLLDGLDEIWQDRVHSDLDEFVQHLLNRPNVIITSRPSVQFLGGIDPFDIELETVGFYPTQVRQYVKSMEPRNASSILSFLDERPLIAGLVRIPIQLDALCFAWKDRSAIQSAGSSQPETMTDLYRAIEKGIWKKDAVALERIKPQQTPFWAELERTMENEMILLEQLAFTGMHNHLTTFDAGTIAQLSEHMSSPELLIDSTLERLSLLRSSGVSPIDGSREYYFLHLTLQEYFAARYIKRQWLKGNEGRLEVLDLRNGNLMALQPAVFLHQHKYEEHFDIVWRFLSGLLNTDTGSQVNLFKTIQSQPLDMLGPAHQRLLMRCLFETTAEFPLRRRLEDQISNWLDFEHNLARKHSTEKFEETSLAAEMEFPIDVIYRKLADDEQVGGYLLQSIDLRRTIGRSIVDLALLYLQNHNKKHAVLAAFSFLKRFAHDQSTEKSILPAAVTQKVLDGLHHRDIDIRRAASEVFRCRPSLPPSMLHAVLLQHRNEDSEIRLAVIQALEHNQRSLPRDTMLAVFSERLNDKDSGIRKAAVRVLQGLNLPEAVLQAVTERLNDKDFTTRRDAIKVLESQRNMPESVLQAVAKRLDDKDYDVRQSAVQTLEMQPNIPETVLQAFAQHLDNEDYELRRAAVNILKTQPEIPETVLQTVTEKLKSKKFIVEWDILHILRSQRSLPDKLIWTSVEGIEDKNSEVRRAAFVILKGATRLPESALQLIVEKMENKDFNVQQDASEILKEHLSPTEAAFQAVVRNLENKDPGVRLAAIGVLTFQSSLPNSVIVILINMLEDQDSHIKSAVIRVLQNQQDQTEAILQGIVRRLEDREPGIREEAIRALETHPRVPETILQAFAERLHDTSSSVSSAAFKGLRKQLHLPETLLLVFVQRLLDKKESVRQQATSLLAKQTSLPEAVLQAIILIVVDEDNAPVIRWAAFKVFNGPLSLPEAVVKASIQMLQNGYSDDDEDSAWDYLEPVLQILKVQSNLSTPLLQIVVKLLAGKVYTVVQESAIECLVNQASLPKAILSEVVEMLNDDEEDFQTRWTAFEVLRRLPVHPELAFEAIASRLRGSNWKLSEAAQGFLRNQPSLPFSVLAIVAQMLEDEEPYTQISGIDILGRQQSLPEEVLQILVHMLHKSTSRVADKVIGALETQKHLPEEVLTIIAGLMDQEDLDLCRRAAFILGRQSNLPEAILKIVAGNLRRICSSETHRALPRILKSYPELFLLSQGTDSFEVLFELLLQYSFESHVVWYRDDQKHYLTIDRSVIQYPDLIPIHVVRKVREACLVPEVAIDV